MANCEECNAELDPQDPPRFDVLGEGFDPDHPLEGHFGPFCAVCFANTATGRVVN